jgi:hypothetical protein
MKALSRSFVLLLLGLTAACAAEEVLSDKSSLTKIMGLYQKVLAGAGRARRPLAPSSASAGLPHAVLEERAGRPRAADGA